MVAFQITEVKNFMLRLFQKTEFDSFLIREAEVMTMCSIKINGHRNRGFYREEEWEELREKAYPRWEELKPLIFQMIRGSKTPQLLSLVLLLSETEQDRLRQQSGTSLKTEEITGAYLNIKFQEGSLSVVTGVGYQSFVLDKQFERSWDSWVRDFLKEKQIDFNEI